jgi:transposase
MFQELEEVPMTMVGGFDVHPQQITFDYDTFLGARYRRLARRRGKQKAIVATGNSVLTGVYRLLSDPQTTFCGLGPGYYESRINKHRRARDLATQLQALTGQHIVIRDGKAVITEAA